MDGSGGTVGDIVLVLDDWAAEIARRRERLVALGAPKRGKRK